MRKTLLLLAALAVTFSFGLAAVAQDAADAAKQITEFDVNGMKVIVKRRVGSPTVATGLFLKGGTRALPPRSEGLESLMLDVAVEAGQSFPKAALRRELARTGTAITASSAYDYSVLSVGSTLENFDRSWEMFSDVALRPALTEEDIALVRGRRLNSLQTAEDDPDRALQSFVDRSIFGATAYGERPDGTLESIKRFTRADLAAYHKQAMVTSRLLLVVVGDIDPEKIRQLATASFAKLPRGSFTAPSLPALDFAKPTLDITSRQVETNYVNGIFAAPGIGDKDYYAMRVAISILAGRVFEEVRVRRNLSYAPDASIGSAAANTAAIYVTAVDANQAVSVMLNEVQRMKSELVTENELTGNSNLFLTTYFLGQETNAAQAGRLALYELNGGGWRNSLYLLDGIKAVTREQVRSAAQKYMKNIRFFVVGDPSAIDRKVFVGS